MSQHRAKRRRAVRHRPATRSQVEQAQVNQSQANPEQANPARTRRAQASHARTRDRRGFRPSGFLVAGSSALLVAAAGAMSVGSAQAVHSPAAEPVRALSATFTSAASASAADSAPGDGQAAGGHDSLGSDLGRDGRPTISRDFGRAALDRAEQKRLQQAAEQQAAARNRALAALASRAEDRAEQIEANRWVLPVAHYDITATFGDGGGLWSSDHTGLDFAAPTGTPIRAVARGVVTDLGYAGAYGNRAIVTLPDGTETWYCHMNDFSVSEGQQVDPGTQLGHVGMTGNTTGPHLHLEVRPDPAVPVDPYQALVAHGLRP